MDPRSGVLLALWLCLWTTNAEFTPRIAPVGSATLLSTYNQTNLYSIQSPGYTSPYLLINVTGDSRHEMGYGWGFLLATHIVGAYDTLMDHIFSSQQQRDLMEAFLDAEWNLYLHDQLPVEYQEELSGVGDGTKAAGHASAFEYVKRGLVLSSFPGNVKKNINWLLKNEFAHNKTKIDRKKLAQLLPIVHKMRMDGRCSHYGVWGNRTSTGRLFSGRNLDWNGDTGLARYKLISVFHPPGKFSHAAIGYCGTYGALTGMSAKGITVHEAGDDNTRETFEGFPWLIRLRWVMENAETMDEAVSLWNSTNNTLGINHGIGSAKDRLYTAMETCAGYNAFFQDNDPREAASKYGAPMPQAVWRTNHAYDPTFLKTAMYKHPSDDSENRYMLLHDTLALYEASSTPIDILQAVNLSAVVGDKGGSSIPSLMSCEHAAGGENIISVAFDPENQMMWLANEDGIGKKHSPACCNVYLQFDMAPWFNMPYMEPLSVLDHAREWQWMGD
eukprot:TRINITY_DN51993_c0_g1_i1.p1 TRINITY_DN51993_c0_g1~~TRINITY_DN51993_c0_g1_i1.p1  ORF type:complete len:501 (+),score=37.44 TRINITY_DN51993_c0_g1_i1:24-1526(+)